MTPLQEIQYHIDLSRHHAQEAAKLTIQLQSLSGGGTATPPPKRKGRKKGLSEENMKKLMAKYDRKFAPR